MQRKQQMHMHTNACVFNQPSFGCTHETSQIERQLSSHQLPSQPVSQFSSIQSSKQTMCPSIPLVNKAVTVSNNPLIKPVRHTARDTGSHFGRSSYSHSQTTTRHIKRQSLQSFFCQRCGGNKSGRHL